LVNAEGTRLLLVVVARHALTRCACGCPIWRRARITRT